MRVFPIIITQYALYHLCSVLYHLHMHLFYESIHYISAYLAMCELHTQFISSSVPTYIPTLYGVHTCISNYRRVMPVLVFTVALYLHQYGVITVAS